MVTQMSIGEYNAVLSPAHREIAGFLAGLFSEHVPEAEGKVWHGHPVWFVGKNPVFGYSLKKAGIEVLFWSGQSFRTPGLTPNGKFKAAALPVSDLANLDVARLVSWLRESIEIQWDYGNLLKNRELVKLTVFNE